MKNYKLTIAGTIFMTCLCAVITNAQEVILTSGCSSSNNGGSVCYSVGQVSYSYVTGSSGYIIEGVQQASSGITIGINNSEGINMMFSAYPNPAKDYIKLIVDDYPVENLSYQLFNIAGEMLIDKRITNNETQIDLHEQPSAIYLLKVIDEKREIKIFKIIKK